MPPAPYGRCGGDAGLVTAEEHIAPTTAPPSQLERVLEVVRVHLDMDVVWFSHICGGEHVVRAASGDLNRFGVAIGSKIPLEESYCLRVLRGELPNVVPDARHDLVTRDLPVTRLLDIGSYVGRPVRGEGEEMVGMLCGLSTKANLNLPYDAGAALADVLAVLSDDLPSGLAPRPPIEKHGRVLEHLSPGGLQIVFQPIVRLGDGKVVGRESLSRFRSQVVSDPALAFREADEVGLGLELELAALTAALQHRDDIPAREWQAVNASPAAVLSDGVLALLREHAHSRVVVEITEHSPVADYPRLRARTAELAELGHLLAVDDAGAGFASLRHIMRLSPRAIKLDIDLTRDIHLDPVKQAMATSLISFAKTTGSVLLAEGVEEQAEADVLRELGVGLGQGYLFGRPGSLP